jgi:hypothetical protein
MAPTSGKANQSKRTKAPPRLSEQAHEEVMGLFRLAEKSEHPEIRAVALELAKETSKFYRTQNARVSPTLILCVIIFLGFAVVGADWYAASHYSDQKAHQIGTIAALVYIVIIGVCLFLSGHLSQTNFMKILGWLFSYIRTGWKSVFNTSSGDSDKV